MQSLGRKSCLCRFMLLLPMALFQTAKSFIVVHHGRCKQRVMSTVAAFASTVENDLMDPQELCNGTIPYPKSLSPSAVMEFKNCPQSFLFQYLYGLRQPANLALAKGSMCHEALEKLFDLDPSDRTLEHLQNMFRSTWAQHRKTGKYSHLFESDEQKWDIEKEREWGKEGLQLLENYYHVEDPKRVLRPNPMQREVWLSKKLSLDPTRGLTYPARDENGSDGDPPSFLVRGIVDRLDMIKLEKSKVALRIVDYKTGKAPDFKYSPAFNEQMADEAFYQLKIYALLLRERGGSAKSNTMKLRMLRLFYLTSVSGRGMYLDMDLGETQEERDVLLQEVHQDLSSVWTTINELVDSQDPKSFAHCDRPFCYCHKCRLRFLPGTLWEKEESPQGKID